MKFEKYYIPIVGWVIAIIEWDKAYNAYWKQSDAFATRDVNRTFDNTCKGFFATIIFLLLIAIIAIPIISAIIAR